MLYFFNYLLKFLFIIFFDNFIVEFLLIFCLFLKKTYKRKAVFIYLGIWENSSMNQKSAGDKRGVMMSDKYLSESGLQGGKVLGIHLWLVCLVGGIPFFSIGVIALIGVVFEVGFPTNSAFVFASVLLTVIGALLMFSAYSLHYSKE